MIFFYHQNKLQILTFGLEPPIFNIVSITHQCRRSISYQFIHHKTLNPIYLTNKRISFNLFVPIPQWEWHCWPHITFKRAIPNLVLVDQRSAMNENESKLPLIILGFFGNEEHIGVELAGGLL